MNRKSNSLEVKAGKKITPTLETEKKLDERIRRIDNYSLWKS